MFVLPASSLKFGGRWGKIIEVNKFQGLPFKIVFNDGFGYWFSRDELLSEDDYYRWLISSERVKIKGTQEVLTVAEGHKKPYINTVEKGEIHFELLIPVTSCYRCGADTTGTFQGECDDCLYPLPRGD